MEAATPDSHQGASFMFVGARSPLCDTSSIRRIVTALIVDEIARTTRRQISASAVASWTDNTTIDEDGVGVDSLMRLDCALHVNEFFHLHEVGSEDYLLVRRKLGDWVEVVQATLKIRFAAVTFRTSGSTGLPSKCTQLLSDLDAENIATIGVVGDRRRVATLVPPHHIYGFLHTVRLPLHLGADTVDLGLSGPGSWAGLIAPGDLVVATPHLWSLLVEAGRRLPDDVVGVTSTAPMPAALAEQVLALGATRLIEIYGSSETAGIGWRDDPSSPFRLFDFWRVAEQGRALARDGAAPISLNDVVTWDSARLLRVGPRKDGMVQVAGTNVNPTDVSRRLRQHESVVDCVVRAQRNADPARARLEAFIVTRTAVPDEPALAKDLAKWCSKTFNPAERPVAFKFGTSMPRDAIGKPTLW